MAQWYSVKVGSRNRIYLPNDAITEKGIKQGQTIYIQIAVEVEVKKS
jgi:hypothetical protein